MKNKQLIKQLEDVQKAKSKLKTLYNKNVELHNEQLNLIHQIETGIEVILLELYKGRKQK